MIVVAVNVGSGVGVKVSKLVAVALSVGCGLAVTVSHDDAAIMRAKKITTLPEDFKNFIVLIATVLLAPNGGRYPLVGGTRERFFDGANSKPGKPPENAQTPTSRVHAVLGCGFGDSLSLLNQSLIRKIENPYFAIFIG